MRPFVNVSAAGNVVFNFTASPVADLKVFALGYREAARALSGAFQTRASADYDAYPILFLYRHSLELYLKAIVYRGAKLVGLWDGKRLPTEGLFTNHGFVRLLPVLRTIFKAIGADFSSTPFTSVKGFEEFVRTLESVDPQSYSFRYPIDRSGAAHMKRHLTIDFPTYAAQMDALLSYLEGVAYILEDRFEIAAEAAYAIREFFDDNDGDG